MGLHQGFSKMIIAGCKNIFETYSLTSRGVLHTPATCAAWQRAKKKPFNGRMQYASTRETAIIQSMQRKCLLQESFIVNIVKFISIKIIPRTDRSIYPFFYFFILIVHIFINKFNNVIGLISF